MNDWVKFGDDWPHWQDSGRRVDIKLKSGSIISGKLEIIDQTPGPDELPIFKIRTDAGDLESFAEHEFFRWA